MRNALFILSLTGVLLVPNLAKAGSLEISQPAPVSVYAPPLSNNAFDLNADQQLLPVRGSDLPLSTATANNGTSSTGTSSTAPRASVVEAIPTPTAFHAGGLLLIAMFAARYFRKLRWN